MLPWSDWGRPTAGTERWDEGERTTPSRFDNPDRCRVRDWGHGRVWGTKAKPLAAYRRRLCCLGASNRAELPIPRFWSEARLAIRAASEIRFVIPRQSRIALRELSPIASLCDRPHAVLGPRKCLVETNPPRPPRLRRSKRRVRCNRESSWHWPMQTGRPFHKFKMLKMKKIGRDQGMKLTVLWCSHIAIPLISRNVANR
jgi:hypothetical protein